MRLARAAETRPAFAPWQTRSRVGSHVCGSSRSRRVSTPSLEETSVNASRLWSVQAAVAARALPAGGGHVAGVVDVNDCRRVHRSRNGASRNLAGQPRCWSTPPPRARGSASMCRPMVNASHSIFSDTSTRCLLPAVTPDGSPTAGHGISLRDTARTARGSRSHRIAAGASTSGYSNERLAPCPTSRTRRRTCFARHGLTTGADCLLVRLPA